MPRLENNSWVYRTAIKSVNLDKRKAFKNILRGIPFFLVLLFLFIIDLLFVNIRNVLLLLCIKERKIWLKG